MKFKNLHYYSNEPDLTVYIIMKYLSNSAYMLLCLTTVYIWLVFLQTFYLISVLYWFINTCYYHDCKLLLLFVNFSFITWLCHTLVNKLRWSVLIFIKLSTRLNGWRKLRKIVLHQLRGEFADFENQHFQSWPFTWMNTDYLYQ